MTILGMLCKALNLTIQSWCGSALTIRAVYYSQLFVVRKQSLVPKTILVYLNASCNQVFFSWGEKISWDKLTSLIGGLFLSHSTHPVPPTHGESFPAHDPLWHDPSGCSMPTGFYCLPRGLGEVSLAASDAIASLWNLYYHFAAPVLLSA